MAEPMVEMWLSAKIRKGLWEPGSTRLSRLECPPFTTSIRIENCVVRNDILIIKDNLEVIRTAMKIEESLLPLWMVMNQQVAACYLSWLNLEWYAFSHSRILARTNV